MVVSYGNTCHTYETYLPDNSCPHHFHLKVGSHQCLLGGYVWTGQDVLAKWFVHLTVALLLRLQCFGLRMGSQQQLQQCLKHSDPQKKMMSLTGYALLAHQPMTLTYCLYILFCSYAAY